jgi:TRAP-type C4-dicarboxylate transport system permease small subunit
MLDRALRAAGAIARVGVWASGALFLVAAFVIAVDVTARKAFALSIGGSDELSGYCLAMGAAWSYTFALLHRANIRVDALYKYFPRPAKAALDVVALVALACFVALVGTYAFEVLASSVRLGSHANTPLQTPLWIPQAIWLAGLAFFLVTLLLVTLKALVLFAGKDYAALDRLAGLPSASEEVEEELAGAKARMVKAP